MFVRNRWRTTAALIVVCLMGQLLWSATAAAQDADGSDVTVQQVQLRNELIAAQESLLNVYRCRFDIDTEIVPGGCQDGYPALGTVAADEFEDTPSDSEIAGRDTLVAAQESLLNVYRCRFDIDTEIVPRGCVGGVPVPAESEALAPPAEEPTTSTEEFDLPPSAFTYRAVAAGGWHSCGVRSDQHSEFNNIVCWGLGSHGQIYASTGRYTAIAAGAVHTCALRDDQTIACWGGNANGQANALSGQYTAIAAGAVHTCALRDDQTIACWGLNEHGQAAPPVGSYTAIAAGYDHSCALRDDQTIACWGSRTLGQLNAPSGRYTAIAAGGWHSCALRDDQTIACWGGNANGQANAPSGRYTAIAAGGWHSCALRDDQTIACWGDNQYGQIDSPANLYTAVASSNHHTCAIRNDRTITCWGFNNYEQANAVTELIPIQAVYAIPLDRSPISSRPEAIAKAVAEAQKWFRSQTDGKHPIFARDGPSISVKTVQINQTTQDFGFDDDIYRHEIYESLGISPRTPLAIVVEGQIPAGDACGWANAGHRMVVLPIENCSIFPDINDNWPFGATYIIGHELVHLLGAVQTCAPHHDSNGHVNDDSRDILYVGPEELKWLHLRLDVGNDDYYLHGRDDCFDIANHPLLVHEQLDGRTAVTQST